MRKDCKRDNRKTYLPNTSHIGFDLWHAKRGNWVYYDEPGTFGNFGRVLGRVHADGVVYLEIVAALGCFDNPAIRWIKPESVRQCRANPPRNIFDFFAGDWRDPVAILAKVERGFRHD